MEQESLSEKRCIPCEGGVPPLPDVEVERLLGQVTSWKREGQTITRTFSFKNYFRTMAFVNAVAWVAHNENHHPELEVSYGSCRVSFTTHAAGGLTENDFICAAKVDLLIPAE